MRKITDLHIKMRSVTLKKRSRELSQILRPVQKKEFFLGEVFLGFLIGVITTWVH